VTTEVLLVVAESDPVAARVVGRWGTPAATGAFVDGTPVRALRPRISMLRRPGPHVHDERLDARLPPDLLADRPTLVFPSIHRSEKGVPSLTVHPLGNPGPTAEVGGRPRTLDPTDPARMADALRRLQEGAGRVGLPVTFEATHHGPELALPAFFVEIGYGESESPPAAAVRLLADVLPALEPAPGDRIALGVGGGHYAPHFTELTTKRRWAFGHLLSRHALAELDAATARSAWDRTPGADGILYARAEDASHPALQGLARRLRDGEAPLRDARGAPTAASRPASGT